MPELRPTFVRNRGRLGPRKLVTQYDVADMAAYDQAVVSRVYSGKAKEFGISAHACRAILEAGKALGYVYTPRKSARRAVREDVEVGA